MTAVTSGRSPWLRLAAALAAAVAVALASAFVTHGPHGWSLRAYSLMRAGSASMQPTLRTGETVLADMSYYRNHQPHRGDLAIYRLPNSGGALFIKRVIAIPGERVVVRRGRAIVNGRQAAEPYADFGDPTWAFNNTRLFVVPRGHVFVLGDNRANSRDSRVKAHGFVPIAALVGRATRIVMSPELARLGQWIGTPRAAAQPSP